MCGYLCVCVCVFVCACVRACVFIVYVCMGVYNSPLSNIRHSTSLPNPAWDVTWDVTRCVNV